MPDGAGAAYNPAVVTESGLDGDRQTQKLAAAVNYFECEAQSFSVAAANARGKAARLAAQLAAAEGAVVDAEQGGRDALANAETARAALAGLGG